VAPLIGLAHSFQRDLRSGADARATASGLRALLLAMCCTACSDRRTATEIAPDGRGWQLADAQVAAIQQTSPGLVALQRGAAIQGVDGSSGTVRWSIPVAPGAIASSAWQPGRLSVLITQPDGSTRKWLVADASSGALLRDGPAPFGLALSNVSQFDDWTLTALGDTALIGMNRTADTVRWRRSWSLVGCPRSPPGNCRFFGGIGRVGGALYLEIADASIQSRRLYAADAAGLRDIAALPLVAEPESSQPIHRGVSAEDSLVWFAGEHSVYAATLSNGAIRWRVTTTTLVPPRANLDVDFSHATYDAVARELRIAYYVRDTVTSLDAIEGIVLRLADGQVMRRLRLPHSRQFKALTYVGACGTDGVGLVTPDGTVDYARWTDGVASVWRSQLLNLGGDPANTPAFSPTFSPVYPSHLLAVMPGSTGVVVINCAA
jgi:hypothetical protein